MSESNCLTLAEQVIGNSDRVLLYGVPGTGKSYQATLYNLEEKQEVVSTTLTEDGSAMELRGHFIPNEDGSMSWLHGTAINAWLKGARFVVNEIDHASSDVLTFLYSILDDKQFAGMTLPNREQTFVKPSKGFNVVATMNGSPDSLPEALADRFPVKINIDKIHPSALKKIPKKYRKACESMSLIQDSARRTSIRAWAEFNRLSKFMTEEDSAKVVFQSRYRDVLDTIENTQAQDDE